MTLHWAASLDSRATTACRQNVGHLLAATDDDVTTDDDALLEPNVDACETCNQELDAK